MHIDDEARVGGLGGEGSSYLDTSGVPCLGCSIQGRHPLRVGCVECHPSGDKELQGRGGEEKGEELQGGGGGSWGDEEPETLQELGSGWGLSSRRWR